MFPRIMKEFISERYRSVEQRSNSERAAQAAADKSEVRDRTEERQGEDVRARATPTRER